MTESKIERACTRYTQSAYREPTTIGIFCLCTVSCTHFINFMHPIFPSSATQHPARASFSHHRHHRSAWCCRKNSRIYVYTMRCTRKREESSENLSITRLCTFTTQWAADAHTHKFTTCTYSGKERGEKRWKFFGGGKKSEIKFRHGKMRLRFLYFSFPTPP